jgi:YHS domain-containing protein
MYKDPVCGKNIDQVQARSQTGQTTHGASEVDPQKGTRMFHNGAWHYFCGLECRSKFMAAPESYL